MSAIPDNVRTSLTTRETGLDGARDLEKRSQAFGPNCLTGARRRSWTQ